MPKVFIHPGHGGHDPGAIGNGMRESDITLDVALGLEQLLNANGIETKLSRRTDISASNVWQSANNWNADCFLDIHANAFHLNSANGYETFYPANKPQDRVFANYIHQGFVRGISIRDRGVKPDGQTQHSGGIARLRNTRMPACLPELAFITAHPTNFTDVPTLRNWRKEMARALLNGVLAFFRKEPIVCMPDSIHDQVSVCTLNREEKPELIFQSILDMPENLQPEMRNLIKAGHVRGTGKTLPNGELELNMLESVALASIVSARQVNGLADRIAKAFASINVKF